MPDSTRSTLTYLAPETRFEMLGIRFAEGEGGAAPEGGSTEGQGTETPTDTPAPEAGKPDNKTVFDADYVKTLRTESAGYRTRLRDTETAVTDLTTRLQTAETTASEASSRLAAAESAAMRFEVALEKGLPLDLAKRLVGATREEMAADADALASVLGDRTPPADLGQGANRPPAPTDKPSVNDALRVMARGKRA